MSNAESACVQDRRENENNAHKILFWIFSKISDVIFSGHIAAQANMLSVTGVAAFAFVIVCCSLPVRADNFYVVEEDAGFFSADVW